MEQRIEIDRLEQAVNIFGSFDENIRLIEAEFHVVVTNREGELRIAGEPEDTMLASKAIGALLTLSSKGETIGEQTVRYVIGLARSGQADKAAELTADVICITAKGRPVKAKTIGQRRYIQSVQKNTVTIGVGPAGTGKTYLAGPMPRVTTLFLMASTYFFCPRVLALMGLPLAVTQITSPAS